MQQALHTDVLALPAVRAAPTEQHDGRPRLPWILPTPKPLCLELPVAAVIFYPAVVDHFVPNPAPRPPSGSPDAQADAGADG